MSRRIKDIILGSLLTLCIVIIFSLNISTQASSDLQSTGKIIITNPDIGNEEIIFDATDQTKLKESIISNAEDIRELNNK